MIIRNGQVFSGVETEPHIVVKPNEFCDYCLKVKKCAKFDNSDGERMPLDICFDCIDKIKRNC